MHRRLAQFDELGPDELDRRVERCRDEIEVIRRTAIFVCLIKREVLNHSQQSWQLMRARFDQNVDKACKKLIAADEGRSPLLLSDDLQLASLLMPPIDFLIGVQLLCH